MHKICENCGKEFGPGKWLGNFRRAKFCGNECMNAAKKDTRARSERKFWERVDKSGPDGCWVWTACTNERGYGMTTWEGRKNIRAHRMAYELLRGPIPVGVFCLHRCDNRRCVNPDHIFFGSYSENARDMQRKGRSTWGDKNMHAKLTAVQVSEILRDVTSGRGGNTKELADRYHVKTGCINAIVAGRSWKHAPGRSSSEPEPK